MLCCCGGDDDDDGHQARGGAGGRAGFVCGRAHAEQATGGVCRIKLSATSSKTRRLAGSARAGWRGFGGLGGDLEGLEGLELA